MRRALKSMPLLGLHLYVIAFFAFMLLPIVVVVLVGFSSTDYIVFPIEGFSLKWFWRVYEYKPFLQSFVVTFEVAIVSTVLAIILGVPAAIGLARSDHPAASVVMTMLLSPLSMPAIILGFALLFYLSMLGFGVSLLSLIIAHTVVAIPYIVRTVAAVYRSLAPSLEEVALILGASRWQTFRHVTLPLITPGISAGALFAMLLSIDNLPLSYFFGSPGTSTLPVVMLSYLENQFDPAIAAVSTLQLAVAVIILVVIERIYGLRGLSAA
ncbi:MAG: ABC transporter permease [Rhizobiales bacterium]|nr:ABC transporter permease [Hyphomicrobiales bacterium]